RRSIDKAMAVGVAGLREIRGLTQLAVRNVLQAIKALVLGGNLDPASPASTTIEIEAARVRDSSTINHQLVIVEAFVLWPGYADTGAIVTLGQGVLGATEEFEHDVLGLGSNYAGADPALGVYLRVLFAGLVE